ncbi:mannose-6-phosphate isomerase, class I [Cryptosporangium arvum]|uniref:mannose-6-phosphate isomerase, class I n=1 Tax=Cryptosporangium arvum TaxID=80871 RepID=UPI0004B0FD1F|nr:mannose-6-phosphate isomerase, class I [Cryptosporangium arvum]
MELLTNPIRTYAWGSRSAIAGVQGRPVPSAEPEAELWMGGHPSAPSRLTRDGVERGLDALVAADPQRELGSADAPGARVPFLLKLLAAETPLSLQAHPSDSQARAGFAAEQAAGPPIGDPRRNYVDPHHKPELICAVGQFSALCGFRSPVRSVAVLTPVVAEIPALRALVDALRASPDGSGLRAFVAGLFGLPDAGTVADSFADACRKPPPGNDDAAADHELAVSLAAQYPGDIGIVLALLLNRLELAPGEAIFLPAGVLHAYLHGLGVEVMAASDNVLRGGLTPKHVDVQELLRVVRFEETPAVPFPASEPGPGVRVWAPPVPEFALTRVVLDEAGGEASLASDGPRILFCLEGEATVEDGTGPVELRGGEAGYVSAGHRDVTVTGRGTVFQATTGA